MAKEKKGYWQNIKWKYNANKGESEPFLTFNKRIFFVSDFSNFGNPYAPFTFQEGYTVYILEYDEEREKARITFCPPSI